MITDFAFASFPGTNFYECVAVSQSPDPVAGPWALYALLIDPANLDDYPKMAMWNNPQPGGAYHINFNMFPSPTSFAGVKTFALDRGSMLSGGPANAISFLSPQPAWAIPTAWLLRTLGLALRRQRAGMKCSLPSTALPQAV